MFQLDLGKHASDYSDIFKFNKIYESKEVDQYSPIKIFEAMRNKVRVFLKVYDKNILIVGDSFRNNMSNDIEKLFKK